ncbi:MAG: hypothetical protein QOE71_4136 [Pseudonocardiales bacterium]|jgi:alkylhydroperoxidase family enzyme|nr:hypothetical protein [Pseudonocardiales bacterium]
MARIDLPEVIIADLPPKLQDVERAGALINVFRMMARSPQIATPVVALGAAQFATSSLTPIDRELAILTSGACFEAPYEAAQHEPISRAVGVTDTQRAALAARQWDSPQFNEAQRALIAFTAAIADAPTVAGDIFDAAQKHYTDQQIVELIIQTGYYFLLARVSTVLDVPLDPPSDDRVLRAGVALAGGSLS